MGRSNSANPPLIASIVGAILFYLRPQLGLNERKYSPELQRKLTETTAHTVSFSQAARLAEVWCGQEFAQETLAD